MYNKLGVSWASSLLGFVAVALIPIPYVYVDQIHPLFLTLIVLTAFTSLDHGSELAVYIQDLALYECEI